MSRGSRRPDDQHAQTAPLPVDSSWRMVEGEHDSFDTTMLPSLGPDDDDVLVPLSSGQPSSAFPSQRSSFGASQDSIRDFANHPDDDHVILREPFRPSMLMTPSPSRAHSTALRTPDPQFKMPLLDVDASGRRSGASSATVRPRPAYQATEPALAGGRRKSSLGSPTKTLHRRPTSSSPDYDGDVGADKARRRPVGSGPPRGAQKGVLAALPWTVYRLCAWVGEVVVIAMAYAKYPLGALLAVYLVCAGLMATQNMATRSVYSAAAPLCRIPGASLLRLPFCAGAGDAAAAGSVPRRTVEFDDLMGVQSQFEQVLQRSADGVSLPFEMKRSETAVRDLRSLVRHSDIQGRHELVLEFDGYIGTARRAALDLQRFNAHVGSAVDAVISINRWTSRYIDSLAPAADDDGPPSALARWAGWVLAPMQPADAPFSERAILDQYMEHTALVSDRIAGLILEAQALLRLLAKAEDHLALIYDIASRSSAVAASRREELLWTLWTLVGGNSARLHSLARQLELLRRVDGQRSTAVAQLSALVLELETIQAGLADLRDRVAEPALAAAAAPGPGPGIPLAVHIETIDRGVERLEAARARIRAAEDERVREAVARAAAAAAAAGGPDDHLIDARGR